MIRDVLSLVARQFRSSSDYALITGGCVWSSVCTRQLSPIACGAREPDRARSAACASYHPP